MNEEMAIRTLVRVEREQELLVQGKEAIGFDMSTWFDLCSTTACFAGHAAMEAGWQPRPDNAFCQHPAEPQISRWSDVGKEVLGLTHGEAEVVFYLSDLDAVYRWVAGHMGIDEQVLRDKVKSEVG